MWAVDVATSSMEEVRWVCVGRERKWLKSDKIISPLLYAGVWVCSVKISRGNV